MGIYQEQEKLREVTRAKIMNEVASPGMERLKIKSYSGFEEGIPKVGKIVKTAKRQTAWASEVRFLVRPLFCWGTAAVTER